MLSEIATAPHGELSENPVVQRLLDELRDEFWVLRVDQPNIECSKTGVRIAPEHECICPNCSEKTETILFNGSREIEVALFCDSCFDPAHRAEIEDQLDAEAGGDW
jgi:hypothetical protein